MALILDVIKAVLAFDRDLLRRVALDRRVSLIALGLLFCGSVGENANEVIVCTQRLLFAGVEFDTSISDINWRPLFHESVAEFRLI
jgi:hypothetical protein